jgi:hypothetical protein
VAEVDLLMVLVLQVEEILVEAEAEEQKKIITEEMLVGLEHQVKEIMVAHQEH